MTDIVETLASLREKSLGTWTRNITTNGPSCLVVSIPFDVRKNLGLLPKVSRAVLDRVTPTMLLLELIASPADSETGLVHPHSSTAASRRGAAGFSLVELMIVVSVIALFAAFLIPKLYGRDDATQIQRQVSARLKEYRSTARHLAPKTATQATAGFTQPPLAINFDSPETTRPPRVDGTDADGDGTDDVTGLQLTRYDAARGGWRYAYEGTPLTLPTGWSLVNPSNPIRRTDAGGTVQGIPAFAIGFDAQGMAWADTDRDGVLDSPPSALTSSATQTDEAKFWALYFSNGTDTIAIAVHGTGLVETWKLTTTGTTVAWKGWRNRTP